MNTVASGDIVPIKQPYAYTGREYDRETGAHGAHRLPNFPPDPSHVAQREAGGGHAPRARYYMPEIGRFIQQDPILRRGDYYGKATCNNAQKVKQYDSHTADSQSYNAYAYVKNDPLLKTDPTGLVCGDASTDKYVPDTFYVFDFTSACQFHDDCYGCKGAQANMSKSQCDLKFYGLMLSECVSSGFFNICSGTATLYYGAVVAFGGKAFDEGRRCCD